MKRHILVLFTLLVFPLSQQIFAQAKGNIVGRVIDDDTGDGLPVVNVVVKGTYYGAATDLNGDFLILNVSPGVYTLKATMLGYTEVEHTGVKVRPGGTTELTIQLQPTVLALGQEVVIVGEKPLFDVEETASARRVSAEEIDRAVVENVADIVSIQAGVVRSDDEIHIRGGRSYENAYLLDGLSVQDPLSGTGFGLQLSASSIQEIEVITGGFNAEYGQAMSGVVNVRTKEGTRRFHGRISYKTDHWGLNEDSPSNFNTDIAETSLDGPEPVTTYLLPILGFRFPGAVTFFTNGYMGISDDYTHYSAKRLYSSIFHGTRFAPRENNNWSWLGKLTWKIDPAHKLCFSYNTSVAINQNTRSLQTNLEYVPPGPGYPYKYQKNLDNFNTFTHFNEHTVLSWTHTLSSKTFYDLKLSRYFTNLRSDVNGKHWTEYQEPKDIVTQPVDYFFHPDSSRIYVYPGDGFYDYGDGKTWHDHYVEAVSVKGDVVSVVSDQHHLKGGMEATYQSMQLIDIYAPWFGDYGLNNDIYRVCPNFGSAYLQDKINYKGLIANLGLRLDYWFPGKYVEDAVNNPGVETITEATRRAFKEDTFKLFGRKGKGRLSPRIGLSHPISDHQVLFLSYGHFSKWPKPQFVYAKLGVNTAKTDYQKFGNPNLNPETTVAYEMGLKHRFTENDVFTITAYYRDIFDYVTTVRFLGVGRQAGRPYTTYINLDYSRARGVEIEYRKRAGRFFTGSFNASYSIATGKSSSPEDAAQVAKGYIPEKPITEDYLIWDRPWQFSLNVNLFVDRQNPIRLFGLKLPADWNLNLYAFAQAGKRYTPYFFTGTILSNGRMEYDDDLDHNGFSDDPYGEVGEYWNWVNLNFEKYFHFSGFHYTFFLEVQNLFNRKNANLINPVTGCAYEYGDPTPTSWNDPLYPDTQAPLKPFPFNPARYLNQRHITAGLSIRF
ncbi:TonB-dependent receptor [candidate division KSB1 bacterium]|nr:TonB-dependent receptor [candidate division KSB1 bacterium]